MENLSLLVFHELGTEFIGRSGSVSVKTLPWNAVSLRIFDFSYQPGPLCRVQLAKARYGFSHLQANDNAQKTPPKSPSMGAFSCRLEARNFELATTSRKIAELSSSVSKFAKKKKIPGYQMVCFKDWISTLRRPSQYKVYHNYTYSGYYAEDLIYPG